MVDTSHLAAWARDLQSTMSMKKHPSPAGMFNKAPAPVGPQSAFAKSGGQASVSSVFAKHGGQASASSQQAARPSQSSGGDTIITPYATMSMKTQKAFDTYKERLGAEDELFQDAYTKALKLHQGQDELPEEAKQFLREFQGRHTGAMIATPDANINASKIHWAQVLSIFQQNDQVAKATELAGALDHMRRLTKLAFETYTACLEEEGVKFPKSSAQVDIPDHPMFPDGKKRKLNPAANVGAAAASALQLQALVEYNQAAIDLQMQAQKALEDHGWETKQTVEKAAQLASRTAGVLLQHKTSSGIPHEKLPRRQGMAPCAYYMKTGDCSYGLGCKWDHPERNSRWY